jgi:glucose-6-phosphate isomerase
VVRPVFDSSEGIDGWVSLCVSGWDVAVKQEVASPCHNQLGIAIAMRTYQAHCELLASERWQRLRWASTRSAWQALMTHHAHIGGMHLPEQIRVGAWRGRAGHPISHVIKIGIGGFDLDPAMAHEALKHYSQRELDLRFVSNVDGAALGEAKRGLDAGQALFIVCTKSFDTLETLTNAVPAPAAHDNMILAPDTHACRCRLSSPAS